MAYCGRKTNPSLAPVTGPVYCQVVSLRFRASSRSKATTTDLIPSCGLGHQVNTKQSTQTHPERFPTATKRGEGAQQAAT